MSERKKRYLMIVEAPYDMRFICRVYNEIKQGLPYELDIAVANNHVVNIAEEVLQNRGKLENLDKLEHVCLKNKEVEDWFRIVDNKHYQKNGSVIAALVRNNVYDGIINACKDTCTGELIFAYSIESLHLESYPTKKVAMSSNDKLLTLQSLVCLNDIMVQDTSIADIRVVYFWYYHLNPEVKIREIETAINNHDWKTFKKWLEWQREQNFLYFPVYAVVFKNEEYVAKLTINEENFNLITHNEYECG